MVVSMVNLTEIVNFLNSLFVDFGDGTGALKESPVAEATTIYTNTNYIALPILELGNSPHVDSIKAFLQQYNHEHYYRADLLINPEIGELPLKTNEQIVLDTKTIDTTTYTIKAEQPTTTPFPDPLNYANITIYTALIYLWNRDFSNALRYREYTQRMWDGKGFRDKAFRETGYYETYKLGLYYFLMRALRLNDSITAWIEEHIDDFKDPSGGYITHYTENLTTHGDPNIETTCIIGYAFLTDYPIRFPMYIPTPYRELKDYVKPAITETLELALVFTLIAGIIKKLKETFQKP